MEYQPLNTYIVKYSYPDYHFESEIGVFCDSAPCGTPPSEQKLKDFFADGDEPDIVEILVGCSNFFIETSVLSQETIEIINGGYYRIGNKLHSLDYWKDYTKEDKEIYLSYIKFVYEQLPYSDDIRHGYAQRVIQSMKDNIVCHSHQIDRDAVVFILRIFGIILTDESIPNQLNKLLDKEVERDRRYVILCKITSTDNVPTLRHWLDKLNKEYHISYEDNQRKLSCILFKFLNTYPHINPSIKGKLSTGVKLLADYFGVSAPTFRQKELQDYIDEDAFHLVKSNPMLKSKARSMAYIECLSLLNEALWCGIKSC